MQHTTQHSSFCATHHKKRNARLFYTKQQLKVKWRSLWWHRKFWHSRLWVSQLPGCCNRLCGSLVVKTREQTVWSIDYTRKIQHEKEFTMARQKGENETMVFERTDHACHVVSWQHMMSSKCTTHWLRFIMNLLQYRL